MERSRWRSPGRLFVAVALMNLGACAAPGGAGRPLPDPIPVPGPELPQSRDKVIEIGRKQVYDVNPGASARARLDSGLEVTIEPQDGSFRLSDKQLAGGRIVARFINHSSRPIRDYALPPRGTSYWVIYQDKGQWISAVIADSRSRDLDRLNVPTVIHKPSRPWRQSVAQWQLESALDMESPGGGTREIAVGSVMPWITCFAAGCCRLPPPPPPPPQ
jgi:hypothetical protein